MKKLSLVLALIFVLTCALVACGGDETDTSSTPATSSEAQSKTESSAPASSEEPVSSEEEESSEEPVEPIEITGTNIASSATYVTSDLYRQGGAEVQWGWDENAPVAYPDETGATMTDGLLATELAYADPSWMGFHGKTPVYLETGYHTITFNLGAATEITGVKVFSATDELTSGITAPASMELWVSDDGVEYTSLSTATPTNVATHDFGTELVELTVGAAPVTTQFIQIRIVSGDAFSFISEVEIYSEVEAAE